MNEDILAGKWKQVKGDVKTFWGKLADDDVMRLDGTSEKLAGMLQERYGYTKEQAQAEIARFLNKVSDRMEASKLNR